MSRDTKEIATILRVTVKTVEFQKAGICGNWISIRLLHRSALPSASSLVSGTVLCRHLPGDEMAVT